MPTPSTTAAHAGQLPHTAYLALGSNLGDRIGYLQAAVAALAATDGIAVTAASAVYETEPVGPVAQGAYLNAALAIRTSVDALTLLRLCLQTEAQNARVRAERFGPRTLDIDILWHSDCLCSTTAELTLPHPRLHERAFVLAPLADIAPQLPVGVHSVAEWLRLSDRSGISRTALQLQVQ